MALPISINRKLWGWSSVEWTIEGDGVAAEIVTPIRSLSWGDSSTMTVAHGAGEYPYGVVDGVYMPGSMSLGLLAKYARDLFLKVSANRTRRVSTVPLHMIVKYANAAGAEPTVDDLHFHLMEPADEATNGTGDALETTIGCLLVLGRRNGTII